MLGDRGPTRGTSRCSGEAWLQGKQSRVRGRGEPSPWAASPAPRCDLVENKSPPAGDFSNPGVQKLQNPTSGGCWSKCGRGRGKTPALSCPQTPALHSRAEAAAVWLLLNRTSSTCPGHRTTRQVLWIYTFIALKYLPRLRYKKEEIVQAEYCALLPRPDPPARTLLGISGKEQLKKVLKKLLHVIPLRAPASPRAAAPACLSLQELGEELGRREQACLDTHKAAGTSL